MPGPTAPRPAPSPTTSRASAPRLRRLFAAPMVVTDAAPSAGAELHRRQVRYGITMAFRTACFLAMIWVPGPARWVLLGAAAVLPYIAVITASQADRRRPQARTGPVIERPALAGSAGGPDHTGRPSGTFGSDEEDGRLREDVA